MISKSFCASTYELIYISCIKTTVAMLKADRRIQKHTITSTITILGT